MGRVSLLEEGQTEVVDMVWQWEAWAYWHVVDYSSPHKSTTGMNDRLFYITPSLSLLRAALQELCYTLRLEVIYRQVLQRLLPFPLNGLPDLIRPWSEAAREGLWTHIQAVAMRLLARLDVRREAVLTYMRRCRLEPRGPQHRAPSGC